MTRIFTVFVLGLTLGPMAFAGSKDLSGRDIETLFSGASMRGDFVADNSPWAERTTKSGRVLDLIQGGKHIGAWYVAGDRICYV